VEEGLEDGHLDGEALRGTSGNRRALRTLLHRVFRSPQQAMPQGRAPTRWEFDFGNGFGTRLVGFVSRVVKLASHPSVVSGSRVRLERVVASAIAMFGSGSCGDRAASGRLGRTRRFAGVEVVIVPCGLRVLVARNLDSMTWGFLQSLRRMR
jgi:hypothetical protein